MRPDHTCNIRNKYSKLLRFGIYSAWVSSPARADLICLGANPYISNRLLDV